MGLSPEIQFSQRDRSDTGVALPQVTQARVITWKEVVSTAEGQWGREVCSMSFMSRRLHTFQLKWVILVYVGRVLRLCLTDALEARCILY